MNARKIVHIITFTNRPEATLESKFATVSAVEAGVASPLLVFAHDKTRNASISNDASSLCERRFFLLNRNGLFGNATVISGTKPSGTAFAAALLTFLTTAGDALSKVVLNKSINGSDSEWLTDSNTVLTHYKTFQGAFEGDAQSDVQLNFKAGTNTISTPHTNVRVIITEVPSYLVGDKHVRGTIPFRAHAREISAARFDAAQAGLLQKTDLADAPEREKLRIGCKAFDYELTDEGFKSREDRAYLMAAALKKNVASKAGVMRCMLDAGLAPSSHTRALIKSGLGSDVVFSSQELDKYQIGAPSWDSAKSDGIPDKAKPAAPGAASLDTVLKSFFTHFGAFRAKNEVGEALEWHQKGFLIAMQPNLLIVDEASVFGQGSINTTAFEAISQFAGKGFNRFGCVLTKKDLSTVAAKTAGIGLEELAAADFLILAHQLPVRTWQDARKKQLSPEKALVIRGYTDKETGRINILQTTTLNSEPVFRLHAPCKAKLAAVADPKKVKDNG